jgi:hypothetical protein
MDRKKLSNRNHTIFFVAPLELELPLLDRLFKEMCHPSGMIQALRNQNIEADGNLPKTR